MGSAPPLLLLVQLLVLLSAAHGKRDFPEPRPADPPGPGPRGEAGARLRVGWLCSPTSDRTFLTPRTVKVALGVGLCAVARLRARLLLV